ncbi:MAG: tetratricopeptide repeat protein [Acidobacteria bacterium]|nr:tetratricopeptide repeat protein [Acidobacteriota bacterium]
MLVLISFVASPAIAQTGRVGGQVKDEAGQPIKGATIKAENPQATPSTFTAVSDDKGRWSMIGLRSGRWTFTCEAPGFQPVSGQAPVATLGTPNPPINFNLQKGAPAAGLGALAGVNAKELQAELDAAEKFYSAGQYDQAIAAYQAIVAKAPTLAVINLQIGNAYRQKKEYDKALAAYQEVLKADANNERAKIAVGMTNLEKGDLKAAELTLLAAAEATTASREVFYNLGEVKFAKGEIDEAAKWYQRATDMDAAWGKPLFKLGLVALNKGDKEGALKYMEKVMSAEPTSGEAAQAKAMIEQLKK